MLATEDFKGEYGRLGSEYGRIVRSGRDPLTDEIYSVESTFGVQMPQNMEDAAKGALFSLGEREFRISFSIWLR